MLAAIHRGLLFAKVPLLDESTKGKLAVDCKSGRKLRHTKRVSSCFKYSNVFVLTLCMLGNVFFVLNISYITDLSPSGPARRFDEPDHRLSRAA